MLIKEAKLGKHNFLTKIFYLENWFDGDLGNVDEEDTVVGVGRDADELVRVVVQRQVVVLRVPQPEEDGRVRVRVPREVARDDDVVAVAEKRAEDAAEGDVDQRRVLARDVRAAVLRLLEVVFLQDDVVNVESAGETRLEKN